MTKPTSNLQDRAMLVTLNISQWTNRKHDKVVSLEVERSHSAIDAGRYNKQLVDKAALEPIAKVANAARLHHYKVTLPWGENGERLLPGALFLDYTDTMRQFKSEFGDRVSDFVKLYPQLVAGARSRLGTMYDAADYPEAWEMRDRFAIETAFAPVASAGDFRVQLNDEYVDQIRHEIEERTDARQKDAMKECWSRVRTVVGNIHERLADNDNKFKDSLIENARELVAILPALNLTGDPELTKMQDQVRELLQPPQVLRDDKKTRADTAKKAADILARLTGRSELRMAA